MPDVRPIDANALKDTFFNQCDLSISSYAIEECRKAECIFIRNIDAQPTIEPPESEVKE